MYSTRQLAYAPTPYIPRSALNATINLDEEAKLSTTSAERDLNDSLAEIYSIIITLDGLEKAFLKDSINEGDYTETCSRLLKQYKSNLADETIAKAFGDLDQFKREWDVCSTILIILLRCRDTQANTVLSLTVHEQLNDCVWVSLLQSNKAHHVRQPSKATLQTQPSLSTRPRPSSPCLTLSRLVWLRRTHFTRYW